MQPPRAHLLSSALSLVVVTGLTLPPYGQAPGVKGLAEYSAMKSTKGEFGGSSGSAAASHPGFCRAHGWKPSTSELNGRSLFGKCHLWATFIPIGAHGRDQRDASSPPDGDWSSWHLPCVRHPIVVLHVSFICLITCCDGEGSGAVLVSYHTPIQLGIC